MEYPVRSSQSPSGFAFVVTISRHPVVGNTDILGWLGTVAMAGVAALANKEWKERPFLPVTTCPLSEDFRRGSQEGP